MFLCRKRELGKLEDLYRADGMQCVVIYGRRRVGKTALINEFVRGKKTIYFPALNAGSQDNLAALSAAIQEFMAPGAPAGLEYRSFDDALAALTHILEQEKGRVIFVIDELPYLCRAVPSILSKLQHLLDREWSKTGLFLILCGSSLSFMQGEVLGAKSPIFGRRTAQMALMPLSYSESACFNPTLAPEDNALIYAVTGGIPHYINKLGRVRSVKKALLENFFDTSAYLFEEPQNLLKQESRDPAAYNSIIAAVARGATRLSEIASVCGMESSLCAKHLDVLKELKIIEKVEPVVAAKKKGYYRIMDHLFRFWYRFVPPNMAPICAGRMEDVYEAAVGSYLPEYMGMVFEDMCRQYLLEHMDRLPFPVGTIGQWWGKVPPDNKEAQLDIVGLGIKAANSGPGKQYLIGSCKYKNTKVGSDELELIKRYASAFTDKKDTCSYCLFSRGGFAKELTSRAQKDGVMLLTLKDLYV